jgi:hypothetical protein
VAGAQLDPVVVEAVVALIEEQSTPRERHAARAATRYRDGRRRASDCWPGMGRVSSCDRLREAASILRNAEPALLGLSALVGVSPGGADGMPDRPPAGTGQREAAQRDADPWVVESVGGVGGCALEERAALVFGE